MTPVSKTHWLGIWLSFLSGVVAAITVTKASPALIAMKDELQLSVIQIGWIMSSVAVATIFLGILTGSLARRHGPKKMLQLALILVFFSSLFGLIAHTANQLLISRVLEGIGIIFISIAAPTLIAHLSKPNDMGLSMGVWALWMPVGSVFIFLISPLVLLHANWHWLWALPSFMVPPLLILMRWVPNLIPTSSPQREEKAFRTFTTPTLLLASIFICFTGIFFSFITFFPAYLVSTYQVSIDTALFITVTLPLCIIPGNLIGGIIIHRGLAPYKMMTYPAFIIAIIVTIMFQIPYAPWVGIILLSFFGFFMGMIPTAIFSQAPRLATTPSGIGRIMAVVVTGQGLGVLFTPPLAGYLISEQQQWGNLYPLFILFTVLIILLAQHLKRY